MRAGMETHGDRATSISSAILQINTYKAKDRPIAVQRLHRGGASERRARDESKQLYECNRAEW